jgi:transglutaminase superfamily protein
MRDVNMAQRLGFSARRLTRRLFDDFPTTAVLLLLRISLPVLKRTVGVKRLTGWLSVRPSAIHGSETRVQKVRDATETILHGGRLLIGSNCLDRSLAAYWMLRRAGASPTLVLGAKRDQGALAGHAWIELGPVVLEPRAGEFIRIASFGGD